jgi:hypothetical protein
VADAERPDPSRPARGTEIRNPPERRGRVAAVVGLSLLEVIRQLDLPTEVLASEDPTQTMPRRLGLSDVVDQQIRIFREKARKGERITDQQAHDLFHLVLRRPDSEEAFMETGAKLAEPSRPLKGLGRIYPRKALYSLARRKTRRRIKALFGRSLGGFAHGPFTLEAKGHFLLDFDPGGDACALVTGLARSILEHYLGGEVEVRHTSCEARKHDLCRWVLSEPE